MTQSTLFIGHLKYYPEKYGKREEIVTSFQLSVLDFIVKDAVIKQTIT